MAESELTKASYVPCPTPEIPTDGTTEEQIGGPDGKRIFLWYGGQRYELSGLEPEDFRACRDRLQTRLVDPLEAVTERIDALEQAKPAVKEKLTKELMDRVYRDLTRRPEDRVPTPQEVRDWIDNSESGAVFTLYLMLRKKTADITEEVAGKMLQAVGKATFLKRRDEASRKLIEAARKS